MFLQGSVQDPFYKKKNDHNRKKGQDTFKNTINQIAIQRICDRADRSEGRENPVHHASDQVKNW